MKELKEILQLSKQYVASCPAGRPPHEVEYFLAEKLGFSSRLDLYLHHDKPLAEEELVLIREGLKRLARGEPLAYILGKVDFYGLSYFVSRDVLIPRPETELLVEEALNWIDQRGDVSCLDLCSGSGCIGITLKKLCPNIEMDLVDISEAALELAQKNRDHHGVVLSLIQSDLFSKILEKKRYDLIVSNPPYLSQTEFDQSDISVHQFEPKLALVGGEKGTEFYERIASSLHDMLRPNGCFLCEIGALQQNTLRHLFLKQGFSQIDTRQDLRGKDRIMRIS